MMPGRTALAVLVVVLASGLAAARAADDREDAPAALRGTWAREGRCDVAADRLTITARAAGWGDGPSKPVSYSPEEKALHWDEEYVVDNFVPSLLHPDVLIHNTQGFHMPGQEGLARCGPGLARVPWPHR